MLYYNEFMKYLKIEDKESCVNYCIGLLENNSINIIELYEEILAPALKNIANEHKDQDIIISKEHIRTSIVRTIIECSYPYVLKFKKSSIDKKVLIFCPHEEYHEIGARMAEDFFTLHGFKAFFVGANIPKEDIVILIKEIEPEILAISVSNYYNIVTLNRTIKYIKENVNLNFKILLGGGVFIKRSKSTDMIDIDYIITDYSDIKEFLGGEIIDFSS